MSVINKITNISEIGHKFNGCKVLSLDRIKYDNNFNLKKYVWAECHCGNIFNVRLDQLKGGKTKSCGCLRANKNRSELKLIRNLRETNRKHQEPEINNAKSLGKVVNLPPSIYRYALEGDKKNSFAAVVKIEGEMKLIVKRYGMGVTEREALEAIIEHRPQLLP